MESAFRPWQASGAPLLGLGAARELMRFVTTVQRVQRDRPALGWFLTVLGVVLPVLASLGIVLLFSLADFSSHVRDDFEARPGEIAYSLFALALIACGCLFVTGLLLVWARVRSI